MGLAPFNQAEETRIFRKDFEELVDIREDGSLLNMEYFEFAASLQMTNNKNGNSYLDFRRGS
jgi:hypothetical protein